MLRQKALSVFCCLWLWLCDCIVKMEDGKKKSSTFLLPRRRARHALVRRIRTFLRGDHFFLNLWAASDLWFSSQFGCSRRRSFSLRRAGPGAHQATFWNGEEGRPRNTTNAYHQSSMLTSLALKEWHETKTTEKACKKNSKLRNNFPTAATVDFKDTLPLDARYCGGGVCFHVCIISCCEFTPHVAKLMQTLSFELSNISTSL